MRSGEPLGGEMTLRVVTSNEGKAREFAHALEGIPWRVEMMAQEYEEIQADTLDEVARASARSVLLSGSVPTPFVLEDAGLFIDALKGFPGVYSAYAYRTLGCEGMIRLLAGMEGVGDRTARFESRIALCTGPRDIRVVAGTCQGVISLDLRGSGGFGFDPIFLPEGEDRTFAEMEIGQKGRLSHRGRALELLRVTLEELRSSP
jgi:XTP/dITP diphosphohydrolase